MKKNKIIARLIINLIIIMSSFFGIVLPNAGGSFMSSSQFLYFTIQSNIWISSICLVFVVYDIMTLTGKKVIIPNWIYKLKFVFTIAIALTFLVFLTMLTPQIILMGNLSYLLTASNITLHFVSPLLAIICFILFDTDIQSTNRTLFLGTIMPWYYFCFSLILSFLPGDGAFVGLDGNPAKFPYFFLDYISNGWFKIGNSFFQLGVFYWIVIINVLVISMAWGILKLNHKIKNKQKI